MVMAHVPLQEHPKGAVPRLATGYTKRRFGQTVEPLEAAAHHSGVLVAMGALETAVQFGWKKLDPSRSTKPKMRVTFIAVVGAPATSGVSSWSALFAMPATRATFSEMRRM